jgi:hypothetical protein
VLAIRDGQGSAFGEAVVMESFDIEHGTSKLPPLRSGFVSFDAGELICPRERPLESAFMSANTDQIHISPSGIVHRTVQGPGHVCRELLESPANELSEKAGIVGRKMNDHYEMRAFRANNTIGHRTKEMTDLIA